jgi:hypothetical protein
VVNTDRPARSSIDMQVARRPVSPAQGYMQVMASGSGIYPKPLLEPRAQELFRCLAGLLRGRNIEL